MNNLQIDSDLYHGFFFPPFIRDICSWAGFRQVGGGCLGQFMLRWFRTGCS